MGRSSPASASAATISAPARARSGTISTGSRKAPRPTCCGSSSTTGRSFSPAGASSSWRRSRRRRWGRTPAAPRCGGSSGRGGNEPRPAPSAPAWCARPGGGGRGGGPGPGGTGLFPHAVRAERTSALAALRRRPRGLDGRRADCLPARSRRPRADARAGVLSSLEMKGTSRRACLPPAMALRAPAVTPAGKDTADRIFVNGRMWTGDPKRPRAEALAVRGPLVLAVGTSGDVRALAEKATDVVDLRGRFVAPGFIDAHLHLLAGGVSLEELRLAGAPTTDEVCKRVAEWARKNPDRHWVTGRGWPDAAFSGGPPARGARAGG